jgi:nicotinamidase/pyrazinamidase
MRAFFDIDTQIDFVFPAGALYSPGAERVIPKVAALNKYAEEHAIPLIASMCAHSENSEEFKVWPPHCIKGTVGQQKPAAATQPGQIIIDKDDLDPFSNPETDRLLESLHIDECVVYGVLTEYCVKLAIMGLRARRKRVLLVTDAIAHYSESGGATVVQEFLAAGGELITSGSLLQ